ncbi:MAG: hypothetical protein PHR35_15740, partial [Kiritimatiellae bacterium]|nr:hypothetical protein [Kiritimatiellia bacterium]
MTAKRETRGPETPAYGHTWLTVPAETPVLVNATRAVLKTPLFSPRARQSNPYWALDYSLSDMGRFRAVRASAAWQPHPAGQALLYPPRTPYWEDMRRVRPPIRNAWILFRGGAGLGLDRLVPVAAGFARFDDPDGCLGRLIEEAAEAGQREGDGGYWKALGCLCVALELLRRSVPIAAGSYLVSVPAAPAAPALATAAAAYLQAHMGERLSLAALAAHLRVSVSTLSHRYRAEA